MGKRKKYDHFLLIAVLAIVVVGVVMITSIGVPKSIRISAPDLAYPDCASDAVDCYLILKNHLIRVGIGLTAMLVAWKINYRFWKVLVFFLKNLFLRTAHHQVFVVRDRPYQKKRNCTSWFRPKNIYKLDLEYCNGKK